MRAAAVTLLAVLFLLPGCMSSELATVPPPEDAGSDDIDPVVHRSGSFDAETTRVRVAWDSRDDRQAAVDLDFNLTQGSLMLRVRDANGIPVFERAFTGENSGTAETGRGSPGPWLVELEAENAKGDWRIAVQAYRPDS